MLQILDIHGRLVARKPEGQQLPAANCKVRRPKSDMKWYMVHVNDEGDGGES